MESDRVKKDARNVDLNDMDTIKIIQRRLIEEYPSYKDCTILLLNCLNMGDPHHYKNLRSHKGTRPKTMKDVARNMDEA
eukprot:3700699-Karenia_brevis.AAC.1